MQAKGNGLFAVRFCYEFLGIVLSSWSVRVLNIHSSASATLRASSSTSIRSGGSVPTKSVSDDLCRLTSASQRMLDSCFRPSPIPTGTSVDSPSRRLYTGAHTTVENRESIKVWRLTITKTRLFFGSPRPGCRTRYRSPRFTARSDKGGCPRPLGSIPQRNR